MSAKVKTPTLWRYVGNGNAIVGVPARDLTPSEMAEFADTISVQQNLTGLTLYEAVYGEVKTEEVKEQ